MASSSPPSVLFALSKRRSTSSPQLHCEATDFSSITGIPNSTSTSSSSWSESNGIPTVERKTVRINHVTQVSIHEPKHGTVLQARPTITNPVVKPKMSTFIQTGSVADAQEIVSNIRQQINPDSELLCCNETIHYLQGSDSDSETTPRASPRRKSYASIQNKSDSDTRTSQKIKRFSKKASQFFSKLKLNAKTMKGNYRMKPGANNKSDDESDSEDIQPIVRSRSQSLSSKVMKRFGVEACSENSAKLGAVPITEPSAGKAENKLKNKNQVSKRSSSHRRRKSRQSPLVNFAKFDPEKYPIECTEEIERAVREREIEEGIAVSGIDIHVPVSPCSPTVPNMLSCLTATPDISISSLPDASSPSCSSNELISSAPTHTTEDIYDMFGSLTPSGTYIPRTVHTQIDYMHCLVPDQWNIIKAPCYWGKIDRYEADQLLDNKPEGTFLLRDSAQEEFLFSVSFCRYGRTLHARIEQWNHKFSFDAHDPGVYSSDTICNLLEHYKDPNYCMFFEPMLTNPLPRVNPSSLMELSRARICQHVSYDTISFLKLPNSLKEFLREYHYKQRVRIRRRVEVEQGDWRDMPQLPAASIVTNTCISR